MKFKPGDRVECVDSDDSPFELGEIYTVVKMNGDKYVDLAGGIEFEGFRTTRFKLAEPSISNLPF